MTLMGVCREGMSWSLGVSVCVCMDVFVMFYIILISHSFMRISLPTLQRMFMVMKTSHKNKKKVVLILKNKMAALVSCWKIIENLTFKILQLASSDLYKM